MGELIYLRPLEEADADGNYPEWFNDPEVCKYNSHGVVRNTKERTLEYVRAMSASDHTQAFAVIDKKNEKHIGNISLQKISRQDKSAEIAILLGEKEYWGKGYGQEAWKLVMDYGFQELKLQRLYCGTHEENIGMQKLALACGMRQEGRLPKGFSKHGRVADVVLFGCTRPSASS